MKTFIGCSGYYYKDWKEKFYPAGLNKSRWLEFYALQFNTVEINNTFYTTPSENTLSEWKNKTPEDFQFSIKANRYFTHMKKLKTDNDFKIRYNQFETLLTLLEDKLGCILWQLPGSIKKNTAKLASFCDSIGGDIQHVIEFRHPSWYQDDVYEILESRNISFCIVSAPGNLPEETVLTSNTAYIRFHGKENWYDYLYSNREISRWKEKLEKLKTEKLFAYFNNDIGANAVKNAIQLKRSLKFN
ncbi:MAG: DUF72 domain-containing protein [Bacteroidales bacterium]|jgi:uncharacterized protein YecE (DUF72 family)